MRQDTLTMEQLQALRGRPVRTSDGEEIGDVNEIYYDESSDRPEFVEVSSGLLGMRKVIVPVQGAEVRDVELHVPYSKADIESAPDVEEVKAMSLESERRLEEHYGITTERRESGTGGEAAVPVRVVRMWVWQRTTTDQPEDSEEDLPKF